MKKRIIAGFVAMMMILALAGCGGQNAADTSAEATTEGNGANELVEDAGEELMTEEAGTATAASADWYKAVLEDEKTKADYPYYRLYDVDQDGVDELFLSNTEDYFIGDEQRACMMADVNGEAKVVQEIGGNAGEAWIPHEADATITYYSRLSGEGHYVRYKLENGELKEVAKADSYGPHHYVEKDNDEQLFLIDGNEVSEDEFNKYLEEYGNLDNALTYEKY